MSKFEYSVEVEQEDGGTEVLTQSLGQEKREVKAKFYVSGFHLLKNKFITLVRNKSSILHRYYMKAAKEREAQEKLAKTKQEPNYDFEDSEEAELLEKLHLIRQSCRFLSALHVRVSSRHDLVKLDACAHRHAHAHALALLHVFARNLRHRKFAVMVCTLRRLGNRGMEGLIGNTRRRVRSRYFMDGCSQFFFVRQTRKVIQLLKRKCLYGKVLSQKRGNETYAVTLRTKTLNFDLWASYMKQRRWERLRLQRQYALARVAFLKAHSAAFGIRRWMHHMRITRRTSPRRTAKFLRYTQLLNGYCALRGWRDSHAAHHQAYGNHTRRMQINAIAHILAWKERRQRHHTVLRNAFWKAVHAMAVKRLGYWRDLTTSNLVRDRSMHTATASFRAKGLKRAMNNWRRRVTAHNRYRMERKHLGSAFDKVVVRRTGGSKMLDGRALMRRYLQSWVSFMFVRMSHFEENSLRDKAIKRKKLRHYFGKLANATVYRLPFEETPVYRYIVDKGNRLSRHRLKVGMRALNEHMEAGRDRRADFRETYYVDKGVRQSFRGWRDYYKNLERLQDKVYTKGTKLHLEKAWMFFGSHVEDSLQRKVAMRNMKQAADLMRLRHLAGLVFKGLTLNHEDLLAEYEMANKHYLSRFMKNGFRHAHIFRRIRRHTKHALVRVRKSHFKMFLDRWRQHMKLKRRARRALSNSRRPKLMRMMMTPSSGNRYYFAAWRKVARARGKVRVRSNAAASFMHHHFKLGASFERFMHFTMRCIKHKRVQEKLQAEHRYHALSRVVTLLKKRGIAHLRIGHKQHGFRRLDQVYWQERVDRLRKMGQKRILMEGLKARTKVSLRRFGRLRKHNGQRRVKQLRAGWKALKKHTRLMMAEVHVHALRRRRIFSEWKEKYNHIHIWHSASKNIMFKNTAFLLKRAFREWKTDCGVERELEGHVEDCNDRKTSAALMRVRVFSRRTHKAKSIAKHAHQHFLATLASCLVRELLLNVRAKKLEHAHMVSMDEHRDTARKKAAIQALVAVQIHRVSVKFHAFKQMDNLMFALKQVTNRARYARMLNHIATDAKLRKCWLRMRKVLNRTRYSAKKAEAACRETGKPAPWAFFVPMDSIRQSEETCERFRRAYTKEMAVQGWFRYVMYCRKAERDQGERFDEWRIRWQKRQVLLKLRSHRSGRIYERHVDKATSKLRYDFALRKVVTKLTLNNFSKWAEQQKHRLAVDKMKTVAKLKSMRLLQVAPDLATGTSR